MDSGGTGSDEEKAMGGYYLTLEMHRYTQGFLPAASNLPLRH
jgi:hypothetical protein